MPSFCTVWVSVTSLILVPPVLIIGFFLYRKLTKKKVGLQIEDWERDVVYLVQFPPSPKSRTISPFSLKLESWLRLNKIKYRNVYSLKFSAKGQIPYIELNGKEIADSNIIIQELSKKYDITETLSPQQSAIAHTTKVMFENHTALIGFHWRYGFNMEEFVTKMTTGRFPAKAMKTWKFFQPYGTRLKTYMHGVGKHSREELAQFSFQDLQAISDHLGSNSFYLGTDKPTTIDCTLFGHLVQFLYIPLDFPQKKYLRDNCPNLVKYVDRVRDELWPDWEEMCSVECMKGHEGLGIKDQEK